MGPFFCALHSKFRIQEAAFLQNQFIKLDSIFFVFSKNRVNLIVLDPKSKSSKRNLTEVLDEILLKIRL